MIFRIERPSAMLLRQRGKGTNYAVLHTRGIHNSPTSNPVKARKFRHLVQVQKEIELADKTGDKTGRESSDGEQVGPTDTAVNTSSSNTVNNN